MVSSISAATGEAKRIADSAREDVDSLNNRLHSIAVWGTIAVIVAIVTLIVTLLMPTFQLVRDITDTQASYENRIADLEDDLNNLQNVLQEHGIDWEVS